MIGFLALMFAGEGGLGSFTSPQAIWHFISRAGWLFFFFPVGIVVGLVIAWWREDWGGGVALGSLAAFYGTHWLGMGGLSPRGPWFLIAAVPAFVFLLSRRLTEHACRCAALSPRFGPWSLGFILASRCSLI